MKHAEFVNRVNHNTNVLKNALNNDINLVSIANELYTFQSEPNKLHFSILMRNLHDIIPSIFLGALANLDNNGIDAFIIEKDESVTPIEMKTCEIASSRVWKGNRGGLNVGIGDKKSQRQALRSKISAGYQCHTEQNLLSKNMRTVLFVTDTDNLITSNSFIDAWELDGSTIIDYLQLSNNKKRDIKLGSFMLNGFRAKTTVPLVGFYALEEKLQEIAPLRDEWLANKRLNLAV